MRVLQSTLNFITLLHVLCLNLGFFPLNTSAFLLPNVIPPNQPKKSFLRRFGNGCSMLPAKYTFLLANYHLATESVTAGVMAGLGDFLAQKKRTSASPEQVFKYNPTRTLHFVLKGLGEGIMWSFWYRFAERWSQILTEMVLNALGGAVVGGPVEKVTRTFISVFLDLTIACPIIYGLWDIPFPALLSGKPVKEIPNIVKSKLGEMLIASIKVWTPVNMVIYNIPLQYRVVVMSTADVFWQSIVSTIAAREVVVSVVTPVAPLPVANGNLRSSTTNTDNGSRADDVPASADDDASNDVTSVGAILTKPLLD